jgi:thiol-disulfide isomerase/thioredoxin
MSIANKFTFLFLIIAVSVGYSLYHKKNLDTYFDASVTPILKEIPKNVELTYFKDGKKLDLMEELKTSNGMLVHFWGTWCAPCEYELPEFLKFSEKLSEKNIKVILLAVNDKDVKIKKFMKRFGKLSDNIIIVHDKLGLSMKEYGVVKVPETFLFDKFGRNVNKFVGPQDWGLPSYIQRIVSYLGL